MTTPGETVVGQAADLFEQCLRALYLAPPDRPSLALLTEMADVDLQAFRAAIALAFEAGRTSLSTEAPAEFAARCVKASCGHQSGIEGVFYPRRDRVGVQRFIDQHPGCYELVTRRRLTTEWGNCE